MSHKSPQKLQIGIVGAGGIVRNRHLPNLNNIPGVEIIAVCNSSYESSQRFCDEHLPHATPFKNWADLVSLPDLDIVWIGTTPYMHSTVTVSALEVGKHVFCQARMAMNVREAHDMLAAAERNPQLVTMLCPPPHGLEGDRMMKQLLADHAIGTPHSLRLHSLKGMFADPDQPAHWRQRSELSGFNVLSYGIYTEVLQRWFGPILTVSAQGRVVHQIREDYEVRIPDFLNILATFENGMEATLNFSGVAPQAPGDRMEVYGTEGTLVYDFENESISMGNRSAKSLEEIKIPEELQQGWQVEEDFIAAVRSHGGVRPSPSFEEGLAYMKVVQATAESVLTGKTVAVADAGKHDIGNGW